LLADAQTSGGLLVVSELPGHAVVEHTVSGEGIKVR
jgi:selenide, water dikinase